MDAFKDGKLDRDFVAVVRFQGPRANGMPELHKLTPPLGVLQDRGHRVALVTDGRMSGASGKVPAAIHVTPEAKTGGAIGKIRDGDMIRLDAAAGTLEALVEAKRVGGARRRRPQISPRTNSARGGNSSPPFRALAAPAEKGAGVHRAWRNCMSRSEELRPIVTAAPVIPVVVLEDAELAVPLARALVAGGLRVIEMTLRTGAAIGAIEAIAGEVEGAIVGAGTVLSKGQLIAAARAGAQLHRVARRQRRSAEGGGGFARPVPARRGDGIGSDAADGRGLHDPEILSRRGGRRHRLPEGARLAAPRHALLPDRRHRRGQRRRPISRSPTSSASAAPG